MTALLSIRGLRKTYPGVVALADVDLEVQAGEVHALVGENGAGKSTLGRIVCGLTLPDRGQMAFRGRPYAPTSRLEAQRCGAGMVMQELNLIANLTVAESIFFGRMPHAAGWVRYGALNLAARRVLDSLGFDDIAPHRLVGDLGVGQQQLVEIAGVLSRPCDLLILDEPTAALTGRETDLLFAHLRHLQARGTAVIYISHRMEEIQRIADRVTVLRDGRRVATAPARQWSIEEIIRLMVGRELGQATAAPVEVGEVALRVAGLCRGRAVRDVSFEVRRGEILGLAGLMGSGRTETLRAVFGADRPERGQVFRGDSGPPLRLRGPRDAVRHGIALLTENRKEQGLWLPLSVAANTTLARLDAVAGPGGWLSRRRERDAAQRWARALALRCHGLDQAVGTLSGGNQQKVVIAKWLHRDCDVLLFDEPTRGIDVGAKFEIYQLLADLKRQGKALVVASSDLPELLAIADRIAVMSAGRLAAVFRRGEWTQDLIMAAALSGHIGPSAAGDAQAGGRD